MAGLSKKKFDLDQHKYEKMEERKTKLMPSEKVDKENNTLPKAPIKE